MTQASLTHNAWRIERRASFIALNTPSDPCVKAPIIPLSETVFVALAPWLKLQFPNSKALTKIRLSIFTDHSDYNEWWCAPLDDLELTSIWLEAFRHHSRQGRDDSLSPLYSLWRFNKA